MIDDHERPAALVELADPRHELVAQPRVHARERLVEEQHRGLQHQAAPELQELLLPAREVSGMELLEVGQTEEVQVAAGAARDLVPPGVRARQARHEHVLEHGHAAEELRQLERPGHAHAGVDVRRPAAHPPAAHQHLAAVGLEVSRQEVDERGLAGAIRPDQPDEVALGDDEVHRVVGDDAAEPLDQPHAPDELGALAHAAESFCGRSRAAGRGLTRASPSRTNRSHTGVTRPFRAKRMVSSSRMPNSGSRHWP